MKASSFMLLFMSVNVFLGLISFSMADMNSSQIFDFGSTVAGAMSSTGEINGSFNATYGDAELTLSDSVDVGAGSSFTDSFRSMKTWFDDTDTTFGWISSIVRQPAGFMFKMGLPDFIVFAFSAIWYSIAIISLIALAIGRDQ